MYHTMMTMKEARRTVARAREGGSNPERLSYALTEVCDHWADICPQVKGTPDNLNLRVWYTATGRAIAVQALWYSQSRMTPGRIHVFPRPLRSPEKQPATLFQAVLPSTLVTTDML